MVFILFLISQAFAQPLCSTNFNISPASWISQIEEINQCRPLTNAGDARVFDVTRGEQIRAVHRDEGISGGNVQIVQHRVPNDHKGTLKYLGNQTYEMAFQLNLTADPTATVTADVMMNRIRNCLDAARPGLRGPNGEQLNLIALTPVQANAMGDLKPPPINITVTAPRVRGNANVYSSDFRCDPIVHELLHYAGLCDEYRDNGDDENASSCRALGPGDSIMSEGMDVAFDASVGELGRCDLPADSQHLGLLRSANPVLRELVMRKKHFQIGNYEATGVGLPVNTPEPKAVFCSESGPIEATLPSNVEEPFNRLITNTANSLVIESYLTPRLLANGSPEATHKTVLTCNCPADNVACAEFLNLIRPEALAITSPARKVYTCPDFQTRQAPTNFTMPTGQVVLEGTTVHYRNRPTGRSMLHPAHFARIINGPCHIASTPDVVKRYNECARFSVNSSMEGIGGENPCSTRPAYCNQPDTWLGASPTATSP